MVLIQHSHSLSNSNDNKKIDDLIKGYCILPFITPKDTFLLKIMRVVRATSRKFRKLGVISIEFSETI